MLRQWNCVEQQEATDNVYKKSTYPHKENITHNGTQDRIDWDKRKHTVFAQDFLSVFCTKTLSPRTAD
jgi:hypothetical protein